MTEKENLISNGVLFNAYPDSIGTNLKDILTMLKMPAFKDAFSLLYILPTNNSDLESGFSIIKDELHEALVSKENLTALAALKIQLKFDIVINHLSVASPQFNDLNKKADQLKLKDFFIDWNEFWKKNGDLNDEKTFIPKKEFLDKFLMHQSDTWDYLAQINELAKKNNLVLLPKIHAVYGLHLHDEIAKEGYIIYDFFLSGLTIHAIEKGTNTALLTWGKEIIKKNFKTINILGGHDGIPLLDLKGKTVNGTYQIGLLPDIEINEMMELMIARGGSIKNLAETDSQKKTYDPIKISYFSALGENVQKLLLARAIQLFMPGIPQIWYLDLFAGAGEHKEINRTTVSLADIEAGLQTEVVTRQLALIRLRNTSKAFLGTVEFQETMVDELNIIWTNENETAQLEANLKTHEFSIRYTEFGTEQNLSFATSTSTSTSTSTPPSTSTPTSTSTSTKDIEARIFTLKETGGFIELIKLLKIEQLAQSGGHAKFMVEEGEVFVNGEQEFRKRKKLRNGDRVLVEATQIEIRE